MSVIRLTKRLVKGEPLTSLEGDGNLTKIEQALNDAQASATSVPAVDGVTLDVAAGVLKVKDAGITEDQLADDAVTEDKVADDAITPRSAKSASVLVAVVDNLDGTGAAAINWALSGKFYIDLTLHTTFSFSNVKDGQDILVRVKQSGVAAKTATWPAVEWSGGVAPVMTATLSKVDYYSFASINGHFIGSALQNCS
jgi:hypothetical protein